MDDPRYQAARRRVLLRLIWRLSFVLDVIFFLLLMWVLWLSVSRTPGGEDDIGALFATFIFGSVLLVHGALAFNVFNRIVDRAARRELETSPPEKPKRLELSDDGEVLEVVEDDLYSEERHVQR